MTESNRRPEPPAAPSPAEEERFVLKVLMALFVLAGLVIAALTLFGGGLAGD